MGGLKRSRRRAIRSAKKSCNDNLFLSESSQEIASMILRMKYHQPRYPHDLESRLLSHFRQSLRLDLLKNLRNYREEAMRRRT